MAGDGMKKIAVIGTGLIGAAWAALFLAKGKQVVAIDPGPGGEAALKDEISRLWPGLVALADAPKQPDFARLSFHPEMGTWLADCDYVQENAPEKLDIKRALFAALEEWIAPEVPVASSTSALLIGDIQTACRHPERCLAAHPFNPPHLLALVEISGGPLTAPGVLERAAGFYRSLGKEPVILAREIEGHIAGRLSAALFREAVSLLDQGVASVEDIDRAMRKGPGLRLAALGPFLSYHLGGGAGGIAHYLDHLGESQQRRWESLGTPVLDEALKARIVQGVAQETKGENPAELAARRDRKLVTMTHALREGSGGGG